MEIFYTSDSDIKTDLVSLEILGSPLDSEANFCGSDQYVAERYDLVTTDPSADQPGLYKTGTG